MQQEKPRFCWEGRAGAIKAAKCGIFIQRSEGVVGQAAPNDKSAPAGSTRRPDWPQRRRKPCSARRFASWQDGSRCACDCQLCCLDRIQHVQVCWLKHVVMHTLKTAPAISPAPARMMFPKGSLSCTICCVSASCCTSSSTGDDWRHCHWGNLQGLGQLQSLSFSAKQSGACHCGDRYEHVI